MVQVRRWPARGKPDDRVPGDHDGWWPRRGRSAAGRPRRGTVEGMTKGRGGAVAGYGEVARQNASCRQESRENPGRRRTKFSPAPGLYEGISHGDEGGAWPDMWRWAREHGNRSSAQSRDGGQNGFFSGFGNNAGMTTITCVSAATVAVRCRPGEGADVDCRPGFRPYGFSPGFMARARDWENKILALFRVPRDR